MLAERLGGKRETQEKATTNAQKEKSVSLEGVRRKENGEKRLPQLNKKWKSVSRVVERKERKVGKKLPQMIKRGKVLAGRKLEERKVAKKGYHN